LVFFTVFICPPNKLTSSAWTQSWSVPFNSSSSLSSWTLLMSYSKADLMSSGDKASSSFRPFYAGNVSETNLCFKMNLFGCCALWSGWNWVLFSDVLAVSIFSVYLTCHKSSPILTLLYVTFKHILIQNLASFMNAVWYFPPKWLIWSYP
jgi:hypothetical protein